MRTFGQKLKENIEANNAVQQRVETAKTEAELNRLARERASVERLIARIKEKLIDDIQRGKPSPSVSVKRYADYQKIEHFDRSIFAKKNKHWAGFKPIANFDLWENMVDFFESEQLTVEVHCEHDGMGIKSWGVVVLKPIAN